MQESPFVSLLGTEKRVDFPWPTKLSCELEKAIVAAGLK